MAEFFIFELASTLPFHLFAYIPFWQKLRFSKKLSGIILALIELLYLLAVSLLAHTGVSYTTTRMSAVPIFGIFFFILVKENPGKIVFLYMFTMDYCMLVRAVALYILSQVFPACDNAFSMESGLLTLLLFFVSLPFMLRYFLKTSQRILAIDAPDIWKFIWLLPTVISTTILFSTHHRQVDPDPGFLLSRVMLIICMFLIYYNVIQLVSQTLRQQEDAQHIHHLEQIAQIQANQYRLLQTHIEETRRARHDLRQHLRAIQGYIKEKDIPSLSTYIKTYGESLPTDSGRTFSQNTAVDSVLRFYAEKAEAAGISIDIVFPAGDPLVIPEPELCVLLGNLLENCSSADGRPFIRLRAAQIGDQTLSLTVDNSCLHPPVMENGHLRSRKHGGLGIGTESVRITAEKHHGHVRFEWKDGIFFTSVLLNL